MGPLRKHRPRALTKPHPAASVPISTHRARAVRGGPGLRGSVAGRAATRSMTRATSSIRRRRTTGSGAMDVPE